MGARVYLAAVAAHRGEGEAGVPSRALSNSGLPPPISGSRHTSRSRWESVRSRTRSQAFGVVEDAGPRAGARQTTSPLRASARRSHGRRTRERRAVRACPPYSRRGKRLYSATSARIVDSKIGAALSVAVTAAPPMMAAAAPTVRHRYVSGSAAALPVAA